MVGWVSLFLGVFVFFFHEHKVSIYINPSLWNCRQLSSCVRIGPTIYTLYKSTERAQIYRRQSINITASDGDVERVLLSSHTRVQLSV